MNEYSPAFFDELQGIAQGAEREFEEIVMLNTYYEIYERYPFSPKCTSFALANSATLDRTTYIGQNGDDNADWYWNGEMPALLKHECDSGPNILTFTYPGLPISAGINSEGISLCWNSMHCEESKIGVPTTAIAAEILHQSRIGDALEAILRAERAESFNFVIADADGEIYDVEATPDDTDIIYVDDYIGHGNNFVSKKLHVKRDSIAHVQYDTIVRTNRMNKLLKEKYGSFDLAKAMDLLKDHVNYPKSICRHLALGEKLSWITYGSFIMVPAKKEMWVCHGNPCQNQFSKHTI
jgi:isopenicillin-N N-acyltransferase-like protein